MVVHGHYQERKHYFGTLSYTQTDITLPERVSALWHCNPTTLTKLDGIFDEENIIDQEDDIDQNSVNEIDPRPNERVGDFGAKGSTTT